MKKIYLRLVILFLFIISLVSCSKDSEYEPVYGKWQLESIKPDAIMLTDCDKKEIIEFSKDGKLTRTVFKSSSSDENENCDEISTTTYRWINIQTGHYTFTQNPDTDNEIDFRAEIFVMDNKFQIRSEFFENNHPTLSTYRFYKKI